MNLVPVVLIIAALLVLAAAVTIIVYVVRRRSTEMSEAGVVAGVTPSAPEEDAFARRENLERVRVLVRHRLEVSVSDVQDMLGFDRAQAERYLATLAAEGFVVSVGRTGRGEVFRVK